MATLVDTRQDTLVPANACDHDGKGSGRLVVEEGGLRREIVCECGKVMIVLGRQEYRTVGQGPREARGSIEQEQRAPLGDAVAAVSTCTRS
jgi:hypothetical protein